MYSITMDKVITIVVHVCSLHLLMFAEKVDMKYMYTAIHM